MDKYGEAARRYMVIHYPYIENPKWDSILEGHITDDFRWYYEHYLQPAIDAAMKEALEKREKNIQARANFLWPHEEVSIEEAGYEFVNGLTEEYRKQWWETLLERIRDEREKERCVWKCDEKGIWWHSDCGYLTNRDFISPYCEMCGRPILVPQTETTKSIPNKQTEENA